MTGWGHSVNLVSAFGRGRALAEALRDRGFSARILDFTSAFPDEYRRGPGPFPIVRDGLLEEHTRWLARGRELPRGLVFWLRDGPVELNSVLTPYYERARPEVRALVAGGRDFGEDWLRRFLLQWASPWHQEPWEVQRGSAFPHARPLAVLRSHDELEAMDFGGTGDAPVPCTAVRDAQFEGARLAEVMVDSGQALAFAADQWIWCLSSRETEIVASHLAERLFVGGVRRPAWCWISFAANCEAGPWLEGFPRHTVVLGDVFLPWVCANALVLRRLDPDGFRIWLKVPAAYLGIEDRRAEWAEAARTLLQQRLHLARWSVRAQEWGICPHSQVFETPSHRVSSAVTARNVEWIAPETLDRLDFGARMEREKAVLDRLVAWRADQQRRQGARRDTPLHAP